MSVNPPSSPKYTDMTQNTESLQSEFKIHNDGKVELNGHVYKVKIESSSTSSVIKNKDLIEKIIGILMSTTVTYKELSQTDITQIGVITDQKPEGEKTDQIPGLNERKIATIRTDTFSSTDTFSKSFIEIASIASTAQKIFDATTNSNPSEDNTQNPPHSIALSVLSTTKIKFIEVKNSSVQEKFSEFKKSIEQTARKVSEKAGKFLKEEKPEFNPKLKLNAVLEKVKNWFNSTNDWFKSTIVNKGVSIEEIEDLEVKPFSLPERNLNESESKFIEVKNSSVQEKFSKFKKSITTTTEKVLNTAREVLEKEKPQFIGKLNAVLEKVKEWLTKGLEPLTPEILSKYDELAATAIKLAKEGDSSQETFQELFKAVEEISKSVNELFKNSGYKRNNPEIFTKPQNLGRIKALYKLREALTYIKRPSNSIQGNEQFPTLKENADRILVEFDRKLPNCATLVTVSEMQSHLRAASDFYQKSAKAYEGMHKTQFDPETQFHLLNAAGEKIVFEIEEFKSTVEYKRKVAATNLSENIPKFIKKLNKAKMKDKSELIGSTTMNGINQGIAAEATSYLDYAESYLQGIPKTTPLHLILKRTPLLTAISDIKLAVKEEKKRGGTDPDVLGMSELKKVDLTSLQNQLIEFVEAVNAFQKAQLTS